MYTLFYSKLYTDSIRQRERICCPISLTWLHEVQNLNVEIYICHLSTNARSILQENILNIQQKPESTHTHTHTHTQMMKTKAPKTFWLRSSVVWGFPRWLCGKESACNAGDSGSILGSGRSPGEGNGKPLQYFCLGKSHGQRSLVGYSPWCHKESDMTEWARLLKTATKGQDDNDKELSVHNPSPWASWAFCFVVRAFNSESLTTEIHKNFKARPKLQLPWDGDPKISTMISNL